MGTVTIYHPSKYIEKFSISKSPELQEIADWIGGHIEPVDSYIGGILSEKQAYRDRHALIKKLPINTLGTHAVRWHENIFGKVVVVEGFIPVGNGKIFC